MKRLAKIVSMLVVYLVWVFGNSVIALSCHANHDQHFYCCSKSCECHHDDCNKSHLENPHACNHDHSNRVILYDIAKQSSLNIEPVELCIATQLNDLLPIEEIRTSHTEFHHERGVPLPPSPTLSWHGMRAPPVVA